ncbi:branched-chain amino acid ABC transporter permease [Candidatus Bathyarchaeota archaeon]|nr:MAG: branched-chain amino acid ABC transporter permease [Candidatus Bathyarchaeota archaeon]
MMRALKSLRGTKGVELTKLLLRVDFLALLACIALLAYLGLSFGRDMVLSVLLEFSIFLIVTLSLNIETGLTGVPQFGRVLCVTAGAFIVGGLCGRIVAWMLGRECGWAYAHHTVNYPLITEINSILMTNLGLSVLVFIMYLVFAAIAGGFFGWLISRPAIRLREAYLGISLLAFGDLLYWIGYNWEPLVGATNAVHVPDPFRSIWTYRYEAVTIVYFLIALFMLFIAEKLVRSPFGRDLKMLRDCELAAQVYGRDIVKVRTLSLIIGGAMAGVAGSLWVVYTGSCYAGTFTRLMWTFWPWAYMMLGGIGSNLGVALGVLIFVILRTMIMIYRMSLKPYLPFDPVWLEYTLCGLALVIIVLFRPYGLVPEKPVSTLPREQIEEMHKKARERVKSS